MTALPVSLLQVVSRPLLVIAVASPLAITLVLGFCLAFRRSLPGWERLLAGFSKMALGVTCLALFVLGAVWMAGDLLTLPDSSLNTWTRILLDIAIGSPLTVTLVLGICLALGRSTEGWERRVAGLSQAALGLTSLALCLLATLWLAEGSPTVHATLLPPSAGYLTLEEGLEISGGEKPIAVWLYDGLAAGTSLLASLMALGTMRFASTYLHREPGFTRFFMVGNLFAGSMLGLMCSGNLAFSAWWWETIGFSSVLLVGFYHGRPGPQAAARTVFTYYRVADTGLLLAVAWLMVHAESASLEDAAAQPWMVRQVLGLLLLVAAVGKSAQWPLMGWLPRAMEGPTPSSALFYGGMSVHAGAYLILRTKDVWMETGPARWSLGIAGTITLLAGLARARNRADAKGALANSTSASLGLVILLAAGGLVPLATWMLLGNAALRWYQMLRAPSLFQEFVKRKREFGLEKPGNGFRKLDRLLADLAGAGFLSVALSRVFALIEGIAQAFARNGKTTAIGWLAPLVPITAWLYHAGDAVETGVPLGLILTLVLGPCWFYLVAWLGSDQISSTLRVGMATFSSSIALACASQVGPSEGWPGDILMIGGLGFALLGALAALGSNRLPEALVATIHAWTGVGLAAAAHRPQIGWELMATMLPVTLAATILIGAIKSRMGKDVWLGVAGLGVESPRLEAGWLLVGAAFVGVPPWIIFHASDWAVEMFMHHGFHLALAQAVVLAMLTVGWARVLLGTLWGEPSGPVRDGPVPDLGPVEWFISLGCMLAGAILPFASWWSTRP